MKNKQGGFTLIEMMVAIGVLSAILFLGVTALVNSGRAQKSVQATSDLLKLGQEVQFAIGSELICTENLNPVLLPLGPQLASATFWDSKPQIAVPVINYFSPGSPAVKLSKIAEVDTIPGLHKEIKVTRMTLEPKIKINATKAVYKLTIEGEKTIESLGSRVSTHKIMLFVNTDTAGNFRSCSADDYLTESKVCHLLTEGAYRLDPTDGKCKPLLMKCFQGPDAFNGSCPSDLPLAPNMDLACTSTAIDPDAKKNLTVRIYEGGYNLNYPTPYICIANYEANTVKCEYGKDYDPSADKCSACCLTSEFDPAGSPLVF